jgi:hypothetical protein
MRLTIVLLVVVLVAGCKNSEEKRQIGIQCGYLYDPGSNAFFECTRNRGLSSCDETCTKGGFEGQRTKEAGQLHDQVEQLKKGLGQ